MQFPKPRTARDGRYLAEIRKRPCLLSAQGNCFGEVVPHHESSNRGMGIKGSDYSALPTCIFHHDQIHRHGKSVYGNVDIRAKILEYQMEILGYIVDSNP